MGCICNKEIDWQTITDDTKLFSFENEQIQAKVVSVYDGDTVKCVFPSNGKMYKWNCRLTGVDTPELRTLCKIEKKYGYEVRDYLREKILNKVVTLHCGDFDKYGRLLVTIQYDDCMVNQWLIDNNYAFSYDGGTKKKWSDFLSNEQTI
jgi:endonuclease YncB( thermonuclease family)